MSFSFVFSCGLFALLLLGAYLSVIEWSPNPLYRCLGASGGLIIFFWIFRKRLMGKILLWALVAFFLVNPLKYVVLSFLGTETIATITEARTASLLSKQLNLFWVNYTFNSKKVTYKDIKVMWECVWPPCLFAGVSAEFPVMYLSHFPYLNEHSAYCRLTWVNVLTNLLFSIGGIYLSFAFHFYLLYDENY